MTFKSGSVVTLDRKLLPSVEPTLPALPAPIPPVADALLPLPASPPAPPNVEV